MEPVPTWPVPFLPKALQPGSFHQKDSQSTQHTVSHSASLQGFSENQYFKQKPKVTHTFDPGFVLAVRGGKWEEGRREENQSSSSEEDAGLRSTRRTTSYKNSPALQAEAGWIGR